jgi:hypothetical protein
MARQPGQRAATVASCTTGQILLPDGGLTTY